MLGRNVEAEIASLRVIDWTGLGLNFVLIFSPGLLEAAPQIHIATVKIVPGPGSPTLADVDGGRLCLGAGHDLAVRTNSHE